MYIHGNGIDTFVTARILTLLERYTYPDLGYTRWWIIYICTFPIRVYVINITVHKKQMIATKRKYQT